MGLTAEGGEKLGFSLFFITSCCRCATQRTQALTMTPGSHFRGKQVEVYYNLYAHFIGLGGTYGHKFKPIGSGEIVHFDGVVTHVMGIVVEAMTPSIGGG
jgi:hypothetical protein